MPEIKQAAFNLCKTIIGHLQREHIVTKSEKNHVKSLHIVNDSAVK